MSGRAYAGRGKPVSTAPERTAPEGRSTVGAGLPTDSGARQLPPAVARGHDVGNIPVTSASSAPIQLQREKNQGRRRKKAFKNERARAAALKRQELAEPEVLDPEAEAHELPSPGLPEDPRLSRVERSAERHAGPSKAERDLARHQRKLSRPAPPRDDSQLHFREPRGDTMRAYRVEVERFNPQFSHVNVSGGRASLYNPPPGSSGELPVDKDYKGKPAKYKTEPGGFAYQGGGKNKGYLKSKRTPKKEADLQEYGRKFLRGREHLPKGTMSWINFGEPDRALEFHHQKSTNPTEIAKGNKFAIKSFAVPSDIYRSIRADTVHERQQKDKPTKAINVDRAAPNQFGLQQHHVDLLNQTVVPGSARVEDPEKLAKKVGFKPPKKKKARAKKNKAAIVNKHWASKAERNKLGADLDDYAFDAEASGEESDE